MPVLLLCSVMKAVIKGVCDYKYYCNESRVPGKDYHPAPVIQGPEPYYAPYSQTGSCGSYSADQYDYSVFVFFTPWFLIYPVP